MWVWNQVNLREAWVGERDWVPKSPQYRNFSNREVKEEQNRATKPRKRLRLVEIGWFWDEYIVGGGS
jgi:hypothetical protein